MTRSGSNSPAHARTLSLAQGYPLSSAVILTCAFYFVAAAACLLHWILTGDNDAIRICFQEIGGPLLAVFAMIETTAALRVWSLFHPGEPLRTGWFFLAAAGSAHTISVIARHLLGRDILLNPLRFLPSAPSILPFLDEFGRVLGGTLFPLVLLAGLFLPAGAKVTLLGGGDIPWKQDGHAARLNLPASLPGSSAFAFRITHKPALLVSE